MRLWLNRTGDVSLREQLITQVVLGILSRELAPGQRLPSTRDLSRRFGIHANTASAAYRQLESDGWVETRHGSGVFVRTTRPEASLSPEMAIDQMIGDMAARARKLGASDALLKARLAAGLRLSRLRAGWSSSPIRSCAASSSRKWNRHSLFPLSAAGPKIAESPACLRVHCLRCCPARLRPFASCCRRALS